MKRGFSLVELMIVVALLILLATIAIPNLTEAQLKARRAKAEAELNELSKAIEAYFLDYRVYPATDHSDASRGGAGANVGLTDASKEFLARPTFRNRAASTDPLAMLTTPVAYMPAYPNDVFASSNSATFSYSTPDEFTLGQSITEKGWIAWSVGPGGGDNIDNGGGYSGTIGLVNVGVAGQTRVDPAFYNPRSYIPSPSLVNATYDPTNGTRSFGAIYKLKQ